MIVVVAAAPVAELVDARDSKSRSRKGVGVRFSPGAPFLTGYSLGCCRSALRFRADFILGALFRLLLAGRGQFSDTGFVPKGLILGI